MQEDYRIFKMKVIYQKLMKTPFFLFFLIITVLPSVCIAQKKTEDFNIILIHVDDLGWADTGVTGSDFYETPNIDRLAAEGILFTNSYAAAAICSPTRAALLTGKYPARTGITDWIRAKFQGGSGIALPTDYEENEGKEWRTPKNQGYLTLGEITLAERLLPYGYTNLHIGKWHLGEGRAHEPSGFDAWAVVPGQGDYHDPLFHEPGGEIDRLRQLGVPVSLNTDARGPTDLTLTDEYERMQQVFGWGVAESSASALCAAGETRASLCLT